MSDYLIEAVDDAGKNYTILTSRRDSAIHHARVLVARSEYEVSVTYNGKTYSGLELEKLP